MNEGTIAVVSGLQAGEELFPVRLAPEDLLDLHSRGKVNEL
jgi:hypothetical protein